MSSETALSSFLIHLWRWRPSLSVGHHVRCLGLVPERHSLPHEPALLRGAELGEHLFEPCLPFSHVMLFNSHQRASRAFATGHHGSDPIVTSPLKRAWGRGLVSAADPP